MDVERFDYWNKKTYVSFLLSALVVLIHNSGIAQYVIQIDADEGKNIAVFFNNLFSETIARVAVPLFFVISGATFFRNYDRTKYKEKIQRRIKSLLIPYFLWNVISMMFDIFCAYTPIHYFFVGRKPFIVSFQNVIEALFLYKCNGVFWFVYSLIVFTVLSPIINVIITRKWTSFCLLLASLFIPYYASALFLRLKLDPNSIFFYVLGCVIGKYCFKWFSEMSAKRDSIISVLLCFVCVAFQMLNIYEVLIIPIVCHQLLLVLFCYSFWKAIDLFVVKVKLREYMKNSFFVYAMHMNVQAIIVKVIYLVGPKVIWMAYPNFIVSFLVTMFIILFVSSLTKEHLPRIYSALSGNR